MKSVHITNYYHKDSGGISTAYNHLLEAANRCQRHVRLIVPGEKSDVENIGEFGKIYYVQAKFSPVFDKRYRIMLPWKTYIFDQSPIKTILRDEKPDMIEIGEKYTLSLMAGLLRKNILNISNPRPMLVHYSCERMDDNVASFIADGRVSRWLCRRFMGLFNIPMFDFHLANSHYTARELYDALSVEKRPRRSATFVNLIWRFLRAPKKALKDRIFVNHCGVDNTLFTVSRRSESVRVELRKRLGVSDDKRLLLYAGRISPEKNVFLLLDMMRSLKKKGDETYCLIVAGDGPAAKLLKERARQMNLPIIFLGHVKDREELADIYANCDAFVHTNPNEPFGIAPLEALASGLPLVAPDSGGVLSYADTSNSWLERPNGNAFAEAVRDIFSDKGKRDECVANGLRVASGYSWTTSTDALFSVYDRMYELFRSEHELYDYQEFPRDINFAANLTAC